MCLLRVVGILHYPTYSVLNITSNDIQHDALLLSLTLALFSTICLTVFNSNICDCPSSVRHIILAVAVVIRSHSAALEQKVNVVLTRGAR